MNKKSITITALVAVVCLLIGFAVGYFIADDNVNDPDDGDTNSTVSEPDESSKNIVVSEHDNGTPSENNDSIDSSVVFYAEILERNGNYFHVKGLAVNDINFRGEFTFATNESTALIWRGTNITLDDLDVGDNISITFSGLVLETDPAQINNIKVIKLLDDEK